jgi:hypothetical protein
MTRFVGMTGELSGKSASLKLDYDLNEEKKQEYQWVEKFI